MVEPDDQSERASAQGDCDTRAAISVSYQRLTLGRCAKSI